MDDNKLKQYLDTFSCPLNKDVERFLKEKAILFDKTHNSRTYLLIDNNNADILAYFALSFKEIDVEPTISKSTIKNLDGLNQIILTTIEFSSRICGITAML